MKYLLIFLLLAGCVVEPGGRGDRYHDRDRVTSENVCANGNHCTQWITY